MKFVTLSDPHYVSRRMITDKTDSELMLQPAVSEAAILQAAKDAGVILILGDLTNSGDLYSHEDFRDFLRDVKQGGTKIYVTFATHDYHHHKAYVRKYGEKAEYVSHPWEAPWFDIGKADWKTLAKDEFAGLPEEDLNPGLVPVLSPEEIWEFWREFGPDDACSVFEPGYSYCLDLDEKTRCLMLNDFFRNEEALRDKSPTYSPSCFRWIHRMYEEAERDGKFIFLCSHHPMLPAAPAHRLGAGKENRDMRSPIVGHTLADMGFSLAFTGHSHFCDVGYLRSGKGSVLWDISVPSVRFYPPAYREIDLDGENRKLTYNCRYVEATKDTPVAEPTLFDHYHDAFCIDYYRRITGSNSAVKKIIDRLTVKDIYFLVRGKARLSAEEYARIRDLKIFDLVIETVFNMLIGDGAFTPDTPEYKVVMPLCAMADSVIDTQPFVDVKNRFLGGYSVSEIFEPMLFNNYAPDREGSIDLTKVPDNRVETPVYTSHAGDFLMGVTYVLSLALSFLAPAVTAIALPVMTVRKKLKSKKDNGPFYKYN